MKTLIAYSTKYGTLEKCAEDIKEKLSSEINLVNLKQTSDIDISEYDTILIGGSVYADKIQKELTTFINKNKQALLDKKIGLFISCGSEEKADTYIKKFFTQSLYEHAFDKIYVGYGYNFEKMNFFEKFIIKKLVKINRSIEKINYENIDRLVKLINS